MTTIRITASDGAGSFDAYLLEPQRKPAGVVVLIQEIFGVNQAMREAAAQIADWGFFVLIPDLFWRQQPNVELSDKTQEEWQRAFALMQGFDQDKGIEDLKATVAAARTLAGSNGHVGSIGFCLGGRLAFMMATRTDTDVNVSYYGVGLDGLLGELDRVKQPLLLHIADQDEFFPADGRAKVVQAVAGNPHVASYVYPNANHAFARVGGVHWDGRSAAIANGRSAEALAAALD
jgi:carboxymethylenebutenolidase